MEKKSDKKKTSRGKKEKSENEFSDKKGKRVVSGRKKESEKNSDRKPRGEKSDRSFDRKPRRESSERGFERRSQKDEGERKFEKSSRREDNDRSFDRKPRKESSERGFERRARKDEGERKFEKRPYREDNDRSFDRKPRRESSERGFERRARKDEGERRSEKRPYREDHDRSFDRKPRRESSERGFEGRARRDEGERRFEKRPYREDNGRSFDRKPWSKEGERGFERRSRKEEGERSFEKRPYREDGDRSFDRKPRSKDGERSYGRNPQKSNSERSFDKKYGRNRDDAGERPRKRRDITAESEILSEIVAKRKREGRQSPQRQKILSLEYEEQHGPIRLNKYISNAGICSRREADTLISTGAIMVNGKIVTEMGMKVMPTDEVRFEDQILQREKPVYILLNKPKDFITTTDDERDRQHVMQLIKGACKERVYPVGRLDRNTTGLLLFTNDGELTKKLTHPRHGVRKMYHVELNKKLSGTDFEAIAKGIELNDGPIKPDEIDYVGDSKREIGITIHSGRNRIVRRIFESLGYEIEKLDRVIFAGLTKKDLPRGRWRFLTEAEINILKML